MMIWTADQTLSALENFPAVPVQVKNRLYIVPKAIRECHEKDSTDGYKISQPVISQKVALALLYR